MYPDVTELSSFYARPIGSVTRQIVKRRIRERWPNVRDETIIGLGYATPYLGMFKEEAKRTIAFMPAPQGVATWPKNGPYLSALVENRQLPLIDSSVDRVLAIHSLERSEATPRFLREIWRILKPEGHVLFIVPNRNSLWSRLDTTPFGHGRPYSRNQMENILVGAMFYPTEYTTALHIPPFKFRPLLRSAPAWERLGAKFAPGFGGLIMIEASKSVAAPIAGPPVKVFVDQAVTKPVLQCNSPDQFIAGSDQCGITSAQAQRPPVYQSNSAPK